MSDEILASGFQATPIGTLPSDWRCIQLRYIVPESRKVTYGIVQPGEHDSQGVLLIRGQDYIKGWAEPDAFFRVARPLHNVFKRSLTVAGDLLICIVGATTGATNVVPSWISEANITQTTARVACDSRKADSHFVLFALASELGQMQVRKYVKGSAQPGLNLADVERFYVPAAPLSEQRKIARILTTVDNLIEKTEALIAKYQAIKQGMMHDLFSRGVDEHGHLRPPYEEAPELYKQSELGWIPKEWEVGGLRVKGRSDRAFLRTGPFGSSLKAEHWVAEGVPVVTIGSLGEGAFTHSELLYISANYARVLGQYALEDGDIVFSRVADVGRSVVITNSERGWIMSSNLMRISLDTTVAEPYFVYLAIVYSKSIKEQIRQSVNAGGREVANSNVMGGLMFAWPQIEEQRRIAKLAQSHDAESNIERDHLEKLRLLKTGLMQDLLTGKVRVKVGEAEEVGHV